MNREADPPPAREPGERTMKEAQISREIVDLLRKVDFAVWDTGQGYRRDPGGTRMTPGLADLVIIGHGMVLFAEIKTKRGRLRDSQEVFRDECQVHGVPWVLWRSVGDAWDWLVDRDIIKEA